jgi:hypothetical protein
MARAGLRKAASGGNAAIKDAGYVDIDLDHAQLLTMQVRYGKLTCRNLATQCR